MDSFFLKNTWEKEFISRPRFLKAPILIFRIIKSIPSYISHKIYEEDVFL